MKNELSEVVIIKDVLFSKGAEEDFLASLLSSLPLEKGRSYSLLKEEAEWLIKKEYAKKVSKKTKHIKKCEKIMAEGIAKREIKLTLEEEKESIAFLEQPNVLFLIKKVLDKSIKGEDKTKLSIFLLGESRKIEGSEQGVILTGASGGGKSHIGETIVGFHDNIMEFTRITERVLDRIGADFKGVTLFIEETGLSNDFSTLILRQLISKKKLTLLTTAKDETGNLVSKKIESKNSPFFLSTQVPSDIEEQMNTRVWLFSINESPKLNREVMIYKGELEEDPLKRNEVKEYKEKYKKVFYMIKPFKIIVPYASKIAESFPATKVRCRRDYDKLIALIKCSALVHQHIRPKIKIGNEEYLVATLQDYVVAVRLIEEQLTATLIGISETTMNYYNKIKKIFIEEFVDNDGNPIDITSKSVADNLNITQRAIRDHLKALYKAGLLTFEKEGHKYVYYLPKSESENRKIEEISQFSLLSLKFGRSEANRVLRKWGSQNIDIIINEVFAQCYDPLTGQKIEYKEEKRDNLEYTVFELPHFRLGQISSKPSKNANESENHHFSDNFPNSDNNNSGQKNDTVRVPDFQTQEDLGITEERLVGI